MRPSLVLAAIAVATASQAARRQEPPRFDVVSIKPAPAGATGGGMRTSPGGRIAVMNTTLKGLVAAAYQRFPWDTRDIIGGPSWFNEARFDVLAQASGGLPPVDGDGFPSRLLAMFRAMLEDRFQLAAHWEARQRPVYNLEFAHDDGRLGPKLVPVTVVDCAEAMAARLAGERREPRPGRGQECSLSLTSDPGSIQANAVTIGVLARALGSEGAGREVVDRTGLSGTFDVDLLFMPEIALGGLSPDRIARDPLFQGRTAYSRRCRSSCD